MKERLVKSRSFLHIFHKYAAARLFFLTKNKKKIMLYKYESIRTQPVGMLHTML